MSSSTDTIPPNFDIEVANIASSSSARPALFDSEDREPLLPRPTIPPQSAPLDLEEPCLSDLAFAWIFSLLPLRLQEQFIAIMARFRGSKASRLLDKLQTESEPGLTNAQLMLTNLDLKPVEPERRQWGPWNFVGFWIADSFNINTWMIAASMITGGGLAWWHAWLCVWIGYFIAAMFICLTGRIGAVYHISFPVVARSSFGIWGSLWPVFNRAAMACIWAIWPSFNDIPNGIEGSGTTTRDFVGFFLFSLGSLPAIWFPVHKIRHLFTAKAYFVPVAGLAFFIWAVVRAKGIGPIVRQPAEASGSRLAWGWISGIMSSIANFATLIVNDPDFSRFAAKPRDALWSQLFTIPIGFAVTSFIGIIVSSSSMVIYGTAIWNPLDLLSQFLLDNANSGERFGVFVIASAFVLAQLGTNIAANSVSAGTDLTALFPRFLNIRRGGYICALVGFCMCPWNLLSSSNNFTTYLSAYSVFLSSIAGVLICDYYFVRKGYLVLKDLYSARKDGPYYFFHGWSWHGYAAYISGISINIVGFVDAIGTNGPMPMGAVYLYRFNFFTGFIVSSGVYYLLSRVKPLPATSGVWLEKPDEADRQFSVVYTDAEGCDEERSGGTDVVYGKDDGAPEKSAVYVNKADGDR
ncbi:hypothetical protein B0A52_08424 [Exophiala mesophila]|uniref:Uracil permease n=1 Tax=Exophiala mesophila TaxID=212818 RepID=A0A438MY17_EXOME|nr:hypothetical protein B0A52_08424 [Exophiala mesophila]